MFYVKGQNCNMEFNCINKAREFRRKMCETTQNTYIIMMRLRDKEIILEPDNFVVIGETYNTLRLFDTFEDANVYRNQLIAVSEPDIYVNLGKITPTDIEWYLL